MSALEEMTATAPARRSRGMPWSPAEDAIMRSRYGQANAFELADVIGRSPEAVRQRAVVLRLSRPAAARICWTAEATARLRAGYQRVDTRDLACELGTTVGAVTKQAQALGLARPTPHRPWTPATDALLRELYGLTSTEALAGRLGYSRSAVYNRLKALGITRTSAQAVRYARDQAELCRLRALVASDGPDAGATVRRLRLLIAYRMGVLTEAEAAVAAGIAPGRLIVECGKEAARGQAEALRGMADADPG